MPQTTQHGGRAFLSPCRGPACYVETQTLARLTMVASGCVVPGGAIPSLGLSLSPNTAAISHRGEEAERAVGDPAGESP